MSVSINGTNGITFNNGSTEATGSGMGTGATAQTWQNVGASRAFNTTYTNSTGYPIMVVVTGASGGVAGNKAVTATVNAVSIAANGFYTSTGNNYPSLSIIVPNGATYSFGADGVSLSTWFELR